MSDEGYIELAKIRHRLGEGGMDIYDWHPTFVLRWYEVGDFTYPNYKKTLQQKWRRFPLNGDAEYEWRDVPIVHEDENGSGRTEIPPDGAKGTDC